MQLENPTFANLATITPRITATPATSWHLNIAAGFVLILRQPHVRKLRITLHSTHNTDDAQRQSFITLFPPSFFLPPSHMSSSSLPHWHSLPKPSHDRISCHRNGFFRSFISISGFGVFSGAFLLVCLILYMTFFSPHGSLLLNSLDWHVLDANSTEHVGFNKSVSTPTNYNSSSPASEAPSSPSDVLSLEQIRDIVAPTRGFFSRDYSLNLGWNNVSIRGNQF
jgi:hypothetical protein